MDQILTLQQWENGSREPCSQCEMPDSEQFDTRNLGHFFLLQKSGFQTHQIYSMTIRSVHYL